VHSIGTNDAIVHCPCAPPSRHARPCAGHDGLGPRKKDVDGRDKPGHDARYRHAELLDGERVEPRSTRGSGEVAAAPSPMTRRHLDKSSHDEVQTANLAPVPGRRPGDSVRRGECGSRGSRLVTLALGRLGQDTPVRHHDRAAGAISLGWDFEARVMPASDPWKAALWLSRRVLRCAPSFEPSGRALRTSPGKSRGSS
jgi:hypothetical protein